MFEPLHALGPILRCVAVVLLVNPAWAAEEQEHPALRGTEGLVRVPFSAANAGSAPIDCGIAAAHWYSVDLGKAGPGESVRRDLWASMVTGEVFVLNDKEDRMPVQSLWCGLAGRAWQTRSEVALDRRAGAAPDGIRLACRDKDGRLQCR